MCMSRALFLHISLEKDHRGSQLKQPIIEHLCCSVGKRVHFFKGALHRGYLLSIHYHILLHQTLLWLVLTLGVRHGSKRTLEAVACALHALTGSPYRSNKAIPLHHHRAQINHESDLGGQRFGTRTSSRIHGWT